MKRKVFYGLMCLGIILVSGCGKTPQLKNGEEVTASIEGYKVSANDLYDELKTKGGASVLTDMIDKFIANKEVETTDEIKKSAESKLEQIKSQYEQYNMDFKDVLKQAGYESEKDLLDDLILDEKKTKVVDDYIAKNITDDEIDKYYDENITGEITARHILIKPDTTEEMSDEEITKAENKAKKEAEDLIKKLDDGEDFEKLAKKYSDDEGTASEGGLFSNFTKEDVVSEFWNSSVELKDGEYTKTPVKSEYGYHVILRVSQKEKPELKDVKDTVIDGIVEEKKADDANIQAKTWAEIRESYKLKINDSYLKKDYKELVEAASTATNQATTPTTQAQ